MMESPGRLSDPVHGCDGTNCVAAIITGKSQDGREVLSVFLQAGIATMACRHSPAPQLTINPANPDQVDNSWHLKEECPWQR